MAANSAGQLSTPGHSGASPGSVFNEPGFGSVNGRELVRVARRVVLFPCEPTIHSRFWLVPRRFGLGCTLNFGNPRAAMLLAGVVALIGLLITLHFGG